MYLGCDKMGASPSSHKDDFHQNDHTSTPKQGPQVKLPHNFESIIQEADEQVDKSSIPDLYKQLTEGVFLNNKTKKYWVDKAKNNCFIIYARGLSITWSTDARFWQWISEKDMSQKLIDVAKLENVCWLEVHGKFEVSKLTPNLLYEVAFILQIAEHSAYGWEFPVNLRLILPNGSKQESKVSVLEKPKGQWIKISVGEFETSARLNGEMEFSLYEYEGGKWKRGLIIMGVTIQPKYA